MVAAVSAHHFTTFTFFTLLLLLTGAGAHHGAVFILGGASKLYLHQLATSPLLSSMELGTEHLFIIKLNSFTLIFKLKNQVKNNQEGKGKESNKKPKRIYKE